MTIADIHTNAVLIFAATEYSEVELRELSDSMSSKELAAFLSDQYKEYELARVKSSNEDFYPNCLDVERF